MSIQVKAEVLPGGERRLQSSEFDYLVELGRHLLEVNAHTNWQETLRLIGDAERLLDRDLPPDDGSRRIQVTLTMTDKQADTWLPEDFSDEWYAALNELGLQAGSTIDGLAAFRARQLEGEQLKPVDREKLASGTWVDVEGRCTCCGELAESSPSCRAYATLRKSEESRRERCLHESPCVDQAKCVEKYGGKPVTDPEPPESRKERAIRNLTRLRDRMIEPPFPSVERCLEHGLTLFEASTGIQWAPEDKEFITDAHPLDWFADMGGKSDEL